MAEKRMEKHTERSTGASAFALNFNVFNLQYIYIFTF